MTPTTGLPALSVMAQVCGIGLTPRPTTRGLSLVSVMLMTYINSMTFRLSAATIDAIPEVAMPTITDFTGRYVPPGFTTFRVVQTLEGPILNGAGKVVTYGPAEYHYGVGHRAELPDGGWLIVRPGDLGTYTAPGYFLAAYAADGRWLWGQNLPNVESALSEARTELLAELRKARMRR